MSEKLSQSPEHEGRNPEELERVGHERRAELEKQLEKNGAERSKEQDVATLEQEAKKEAVQEKKQDRSPAEKRKDAPLPRAKQEKINFARNMADARSHMSAPGRVFSKAIHNKAVEKTSEVVGATVARPNAILAGSVSAFLFTLAIYLFARHYGYPLSGFETIGAFALGWILGIMFDYLRVMITGKKA